MPFFFAMASMVFLVAAVALFLVLVEIKIKQVNQRQQQQAKSEQTNRPNYNEWAALQLFFVHTQGVGTNAEQTLQCIIAVLIHNSSPILKQVGSKKKIDREQ